MDEPMDDKPNYPLRFGVSLVIIGIFILFVAMGGSSSFSAETANILLYVFAGCVAIGLPTVVASLS